MGDEPTIKAAPTSVFEGHGAPAPLQFTDRERAQIRACQAYAKQFEASGLPGHGLFMLVSKMSALLEDAVSRFGYAPDKSPPVKVQQIAWNGSHETGEGCWRDIRTGVRVEVSE